MNPILEAQRITEVSGSDQFGRDLKKHLVHGFVVSTPQGFAMGRPVRHDAPLDELMQISVAFENPDCWLIWCAAGQLSVIAQFLPFWLPLIAFHRADERRAGVQKLRVYQTSRLVELARAGLMTNAEHPNLKPEI